jgi:hypothetical protein
MLQTAANVEVEESAALQHPHTAQGLNMVHPTIGLVAVMCRTALVLTPALAAPRPMGTAVLR